MRVGLLTIDSRGGVQPLLALALRLQALGHEVVFVQPTDLVDMIRARGIESRPLDVSVKQLLARRGAGSGGRREQIALARAELPSNLATWMRQAHDALRGVDVVVAGTTALAVGAAVADAFDVPLVAAHLQPIGPPTTRFPGIWLPRLPRWTGGAGNLMSHVLTNATMSLPMRAAVGRARAQALGLPRRARAAHMVLYGYSPHVVPKPPTWSRDRLVTGYWTMPTGDWSPSAALAAFLEAGPPPVCIGFGSMPIEDPRAVADLAVAVARAVGRRALLIGGWGGLASDGAAADVFAIDEVPHDWLFPQVAAVVHHGGAGTTGAAVTAGVPSVIVPWGADQPFWAARLEALGVGTAPIPKTELSQTRLTSALSVVLTDGTLRGHATQLGVAVRAEDGTGTAARAVASVAADTSRAR
jgi:sterol 3beta-glucosyltransferase